MFRLLKKQIRCGKKSNCDCGRSKNSCRYQGKLRHYVRVYTTLMAVNIKLGVR